jgi:hypothetical protein
MKSRLVVGFIGAYLCLLSWGVFSHAVSFMSGSHPAMYFVVWDMFCGWSAYSSRYHVLAEGESGQWYEVAPAPWGEFVPYGKLGRHHYDSFCAHLERTALNTLEHTAHEPITRVFIVEESWAKKYNMPDHIWQARHEERKPRPEEITRYYRVRRVLAGDGTPQHSFTGWFDYQGNLALSDNPRLIQEMRQGRSYYAPPSKWMPQVQEMDALADTHDPERGIVGNAN